MSSSHIQTLLWACDGLAAHGRAACLSGPLFTRDRRRALENSFQPDNYRAWEEERCKSISAALIEDHFTHLSGTGKAKSRWEVPSIVLGERGTKAPEMLSARVND